MIKAIQSCLTKQLLLSVSGNQFLISNSVELASATFNESFLLNGEALTIYRNMDLLDEKSITTDGEFQFEIKSRNEWITYLNALIDIKAIDKEIPVLRVSSSGLVFFKSSHY
jgi:hypothetical protein